MVAVRNGSSTESEWAAVSSTRNACLARAPSRHGSVAASFVPPEAGGWSEPLVGSAFLAGGGVRAADRLGLWGSTLPQVYREDRHRRHGEKLRLPVLQGPAPKI
jgi:hypothetical protein